MALTTLKDDLLAEFREERILIKEQMELLDPLATSLRKPAAQRLLSSGTLIITEASCYILSLGGLAFIGFLHRIYPFTVLNDLFYNSETRVRIGSTNLLYFILCVYGLALIGVALVFILGRMAREMRLKNDILHQAARDIKTIMGQHLERKAVMDTIEQRHMLGLSGVSMPAAKDPTQAPSANSYRMNTNRSGVNEIPNPGFQ
jgi:hypothetical protein